MSLIASAAIGIGLLTACSGEPAQMPDVEQSRLDTALSDIERSGIDDEVEVVGGGMFGVVDESNWTVCEQEPSAGSEVEDAPRLTVERDCAGVDDQGSETGTAPSPEGEEQRERTTPRRPQRQAPPVAETFVMPALVGFNLQLGQDVLQSLGSFVLTQTDALGLGRFQVNDSGWQICGQRPAAGAEVSIESLVELRVVKRGEFCP